MEKLKVEHELFTFIRLLSIKDEDIYKEENKDWNGGIKCQIYPHKRQAGHSE